MTAPALSLARLAEIKSRPCPWRTTAEDIALLLGEVDRLTELTDRLTLALADAAERLTLTERENAALLRHNEAVARRAQESRDEADALRRQRDGAFVTVGQFAAILRETHDWLAYRPTMAQSEEGGVELKRRIARVLEGGKGDG